MGKSDDNLSNPEQASHRIVPSFFHMSFTRGESLVAWKTSHMVGIAGERPVSVVPRPGFSLPNQNAALGFAGATLAILSKSKRSFTSCHG